MSIQVRFVQAKAGERPSAIAAVGSAGKTTRERLILIALALYLTPALLVVLMVGGVGMLVLAAARTITSIALGPLSVVRCPLIASGSSRAARGTRSLEEGREAKESGSSTTDN